MNFEYNKQMKALNEIDIEEIGSFAIEASNDEGMFYYLIVRTTLGKSTFTSFGPIIPDIEMIPSGYELKLERIDYTEAKLAKVISKYINDPYKRITQIETIEIEKAIEQVKDMKEYLYNYNAEIN